MGYCGKGHSHLLPDNLVSNLIAPSVPTHPSQHPHIRNMHFLDMCILDWPTLRSIQQGRSNYHSVELTFKSRWDFLVTQDSRGKPPFHPSNPNAMCDILIDVTTSLDYRPKILKTFSLRNDLCGQFHFHICLLHYITEFAPQILCFGPTQPEPFGLQHLSPHLQPRINSVPRFINHSRFTSSSTHSTHFRCKRSSPSTLPWTSPFHHQSPLWPPKLPLDTPKTFEATSLMQLAALFHMTSASPLPLQAPIPINFSPISRERAGVKPPHLILGRSDAIFFLLVLLISRSITKSLCWVVTRWFSFFGKHELAITNSKALAKSRSEVPPPFLSPKPKPPWTSSKPLEVAPIWLLKSPPMTILSIKLGRRKRRAIFQPDLTGLRRQTIRRRLPCLHRSWLLAGAHFLFRPTRRSEGEREGGSPFAVGPHEISSVACCRISGAPVFFGRP
ncbi:hypothetical protein H5410_030260 [Solanum commersonii]|uniref:Uncharacterized protein n=1 Tax=Solanum commersonii TaxID=4109 RepID=A0A9J5YF78_SOLCO|nr:hypothetical protein H5410_030260 [Solanum commersonii]